MDKTSLTYSMYSEAFTFFKIGSIHKIKKKYYIKLQIFLVNQVSSESVIEI